MILFLYIQTEKIKKCLSYDQTNKQTNKQSINQSFIHFIILLIFFSFTKNSKAQIEINTEIYPCPKQFYILRITWDTTVIEKNDNNVYSVKINLSLGRLYDLDKNEIPLPYELTTTSDTLYYLVKWDDVGFAGKVYVSVEQAITVF